LWAGSKKKRAPQSFGGMDRREGEKCRRRKRQGEKKVYRYKESEKRSLDRAEKERDVRRNGGGSFRRGGSLVYAERGKAK